MNITSEKPKHLYVPGYWLAKCGHGDKSLILPVLNVVSHGYDKTFATVELNGWAWDVWVEARKAEFVDLGEYAQDPEVIAETIEDIEAEREHTQWVKYGPL